MAASKTTKPAYTVADRVVRVYVAGKPNPVRRVTKSASAAAIRASVPRKQVSIARRALAVARKKAR